MGNRSLNVALLSVAIGAGAVAGPVACSGQPNDLLSLADAGDEPATLAPRKDAAKDTGADSDSLDATDAASCEPGDVSNLQPIWRPPNPFYAGKCTPKEIQGYYTSLIGSSASAAIGKAFRQQHPLCTSCLESKPDDPTRGVLVWYDNDGFFDLNLGGCIATEQGDLSASGCGAAFQGVRACEVAACGPSCPVNTLVSFDAFRNCSDLSDKMACAAFVAMYNTSCANFYQDNPPNVTSCAAKGATTATIFLDLANRFCGAPVDAGLDGSADGGPDAADASDGG